MGKYMKKSKIADISVMEVLSSSYVGVRTRAKTLALRRHNLDEASFCYLQLRSRRLEKPSFSLKQQSREKSEPSQKIGVRVSSVNSSSDGLVAFSSNAKQAEGCFGKNEKAEDVEEVAVGLEASFGENSLDIQPRDRNARESTPCSSVRDLGTITTPSSTTRRGSFTPTNQNGQRSNVERIVPTTQEMDEFFASAEQQQQMRFIEKYNFDIVNDFPLPGRYEWVTVNP